MGSSSFFTKLASVDPIAQALDLPGAHKQAQAQAQRNAGQTDTNGGAYTGIGATLAGANAGYAPGGPGAPAGWAPTQPNNNMGLFGLMQKGATLGGAPSSALPGANALRGAVGAGYQTQGNSNPFSTQNNYVQQSATQNPTNAYARAAQPQNSWGG